MIYIILNVDLIMKSSTHSIERLHSQCWCISVIMIVTNSTESIEK